MQTVIIWGTGMVSEMAYVYYKDKVKIAFFIDSNSQKWGKKYHDIDVLSPDVLFSCTYPIIVALERGCEDVQKRLEHVYNKRSYTIFKYEQVVIKEENSFTEEGGIKSNSAIMRFSGGLGNQMFQYAFLKCWESRKRGDIFADVSSYEQYGSMPYCLQDVFEKIELQHVQLENVKQFLEKVIATKDDSQFLIYTEKNVSESKFREADLNVLNVEGGMFRGNFQSYRYAELIKNQLFQEFTFPKISDLRLKDFSDKIKNKMSVAVHIRRGDYLVGRNVEYYANICTDEYYRKAIQLMQNRVDNPIFYFFSNDIEWVKRNYDMEEAVYVSEEYFDYYEDWYDMYLMSICKHNIIANSTFSWWGAWLNQNPDKIVIAPTRWINGCEYKDIYPQNWICM